MLKCESLLHENFKLKVFVSAEIEFYITPFPIHETNIEKQLIAELNKKLARKNIKINQIEREVIDGQYEVSFLKQSPLETLQSVYILKNILSIVCKNLKLNLILKAKPFKNKPGCGLHFHIWLYDERGNNVLSRVSEFEESSLMYFSIGGLLECMLNDFIVFAPYKNSYLRFNSQKKSFDNSHPLSSLNYAPTNVSWGGNNRTTAIRIPTSTLDEHQRHIEHRVSGVDANPLNVIERILYGIHYGILNKIFPPDKVFGNAFDECYSHLPKFPQSMDEALTHSKNKI